MQHVSIALVARARRAERRVERTGVRGSDGPQPAASHGLELSPELQGQLDDRVEILDGGAPGCVHGSAGELHDLAEDRAATPVRELVGAHGVELRGRESVEPLDDLVSIVFDSLDFVSDLPSLELAGLSASACFL